MLQITENVTVKSLGWVGGCKNSLLIAYSQQPKSLLIIMLQPQKMCLSNYVVLIIRCIRFVLEGSLIKREWMNGLLANFGE